MVFVAVGDEKGADLAAVGLEIGIVRDDVVDAREVGFGEADAGIDDDEVAVRLKAIHVLSDFGKAPQGIDIYG